MRSAEELLKHYIRGVKCIPVVWEERRLILVISCHQVWRSGAPSPTERLSAETLYTSSINALLVVLQNGTS